MLIQTLQALFQRDLAQLRKQIELYQDESRIWEVDKQIPNSAGNLCLHLIGNLNAFIGNALGQSGYVRDRDAEFALKGVPRAELIQKLDDTIEAVHRVLGSLSGPDLEKEFPVQVFASKTTTEYMLVHLATHLSYHLGQVNYHRRLLDTVSRPPYESTPRTACNRLSPPARKDDLFR